MALVVNTNASSLNAQRNLFTSSMGLGQALERLSSGLRINRAGDDAAGLAISNGLTSQIRGLNQAIRNSGDGLSLLGTAESAIAEQTNLLQRIRELAVQSASDTNSASNRASLDSEVAQLKGELDRIAQTVEFNGLNLLDGSFTTKEIQVGSKSGSAQRLSVDLTTTRAATLGSVYQTTATGAVTGAALTNGSVVITTNGRSFNVSASTSDGVSTTNADGSAIALANAINNAGSGVTAAVGVATGEGATQQAKTVAGDGTDYLKINGVNVGAFTTATASSSEAIDAINAKSTLTGVTATRTNTDKITLTNADGRNIQLQIGGTAAAAVGFADATVVRGKLTLTGNSTFVLSGTTAPLNQSATTATQDTTKNVQTVTVATKADANTAIGTIDAAISQLNEKRAAIGAQTNRLSSVINSLSAIAENVSASNSRILDADFAAETASLTRSQILQQAGVAILAQSNQQPQLALTLLR